MPVGNRGLRHARQMAVDLQPALLRNGLVKRVHALGYPVENHARKRVRRKMHEPPQSRGHGQRLPLRADDQHGGRVGRARQVGRGRGIGRAGNAVVKAHHALNDAAAIRWDGARELAAAFGLIDKKQVEITARDTQHGGMEHGVNVIRPAFECTQGFAAAAQRAQQRARNRGLAAAAVRAADQQARLSHSFHVPFLLMLTGPRAPRRLLCKARRCPRPDG